jgi:hypothetical protein
VTPIVGRVDLVECVSVGGNWCARRKSVVEDEAEAQLINKETARSWRGMK